jgi:membrane-associated phospholipid phosphatase
VPPRRRASAARALRLGVLQVDPSHEAHAGRRLAAALLTTTVALAPSAAARAEGSAEPAAVIPSAAPPARHEPRWDPAWSHSNAWDYSLAGVGAGFIIAYEAFLQPVRPPVRWNSPILFDDAVRKAWMSSNQNTRNTAEDVAWGLWGLQLAYPVLVDVPFAWTRYSHRLAEDLFWQDAVTLTLAGAVDLGLRDLAGRTRPGAYDCLTQGGSNCLTDVESDRSFPGGHTTNSTAASVLTCTQHLYTQLYGGPWDAVVCVTTVASDLTIGVLRVVSDNHWATDQIAGMALGTLIGWGVPYVMHFHGHATAGDGTESSDDGGSRRALVLPMPLFLDHGAGVGVTAIY